MRAYLLEKTIKTLFVARVLGEPKWTGDEEAEQKAQRIFTGPKINAMWEALVRQLEQREAPLRILRSLEDRLTRKA